MQVNEKIKILLTATNNNMTSLAIKLNKSPQAIQKKIKNNHFTINDLQEIATALDCEFEYKFKVGDLEIW